MNSAINTGDTAWVLACSALVLMMVVPGLAYFYGGMVRRKNVLSVLMQCMAAACMIPLIWVAVGYSLAFGPSVHGIIGNFDFVMFHSVGDAPSAYAPTIPHSVFATFQTLFAVITPAVIAGAFAERMKFSAYIAFIVLWLLGVYCPVAHWLWSDGGWLSVLNTHALFPTYDFAGGTVVEVNSGIAGLVCALYMGRRKGYPNKLSPPHSLPFAVLGAGLLWVGWLCFNAGTAMGANALAGHAFLATHLAGSAGGLCWAALEWAYHRKPTVLGLISGVIGGLVAITPAAGYVSLDASILIGFLAGAISFLFVIILKAKLGYDDSLDVFGVHGVSGILGTILTGYFASQAVNGIVSQSGMSQVWNQAIAVLATMAWSGLGTLLILWIVDRVLGARVDERSETIGLDLSQHRETAYTVID